MTSDIEWTAAGILPAVRRLWAGSRPQWAGPHPWVRRLAVSAAVLAVGLTGVVLGVLLGAHHSTDVGPFRAQMAVTPSWTGETEVDIPPLGALHLNSHDGPVHLRVQLGALDQRRTEALIGDPQGI